MRPLTRLLHLLRRRYHPLWRLRRSAAYPWLERALNRTMLRRIDVELAEYLVVQGGEQLFARKATMVLIEICDTRVLEFFARHGYDVWMIEEPALNYFAAPAGAFSDSEVMAPCRKISN